MITIDLSGMADLTRRLEAQRPLFEQAARTVVADALSFSEVAIADHIDKHDAIDTGRLKSSISQKDEQGRDGQIWTFRPKDTAVEMDEVHEAGGVSQVRGVVGTNVHYAIPVHEGYTTSTGRHIDGRPYMADAVPEIEAHLERTARETFGSLLR